MLPFESPGAADPMYKQLRIERIIAESNDAATFVLSPLQEKLSYRAGQFLTFVFRERDMVYRRSYSISSSMEAGEPLSITVKRISNGVFSRPLLDHAEVGDILTIVGGATGFFTLDEDMTGIDQVFFLAAGSGITPVYPLIVTCLHEHKNVRPVLIYSNHSPATTIFRSKVEALQKNTSLKVEWLFSNNSDLMRARLGKSVLQQLLHSHLTTSLERTRFYLCGPFDYMRMAAIVLQTEGIDPGQIKREIFSPLPVPTAEAPPDMSPHSVRIRQGKSSHHFSSQYPDSILTAARKNGIVLPYSCEAGRCGSCVAQCTRGKIWMRYNEVLTDREVEKGRILVCQSFPVGGDVEIEYAE